MADIFSDRAGYVAVVPSQSVIPGRIVVEGFEPAAALISGVDYKQTTNQQFLTSLDEAVYIYVFGDNMGAVVVQGMAFPATCDGAQEGLLEVFQYYEQNRASKKPTPVNVQIGSGETISGFLTALRVNAVGVADDPSSFRNAFEMTISAMPKR